MIRKANLQRALIWTRKALSWRLLLITLWLEIPHVAIIIVVPLDCGSDTDLVGDWNVCANWEPINGDLHIFNPWVMFGCTSSCIQIHVIPFCKQYIPINIRYKTLF